MDSSFKDQQQPMKYISCSKTKKWKTGEPVVFIFLYIINLKCKLHFEIRFSFLIIIDTLFIRFRCMLTCTFNECFHLCKWFLCCPSKFSIKHVEGDFIHRYVCDEAIPVPSSLPAPVVPKPFLA